MARSKRKVSKRTRNRRALWRWRPLPWRSLATGGGFALAAFSALALLSPGANAVTQVWAHFLRCLLGWSAYLFPLALAAGLYWFAVRRAGVDAVRVTGVFLLLVTLLCLTHLALRLPNPFVLSVAGYGGGILGWALSTMLMRLGGRIGAYFFSGSLLCIGAMLAFDFSPYDVWRLTRSLASKTGRAWVNWRRSRYEARHLWDSDTEQLPLPLVEPEPHVETGPSAQAMPEPASPAALPPEPQEPPGEADKNAAPAAPEPLEPVRSSDSPLANDERLSERPEAAWQLPDARKIFTRVSEADVHDDLVEERAAIIEETLEAFGVPAHVVGVERGPTVTQFAVRPGTIEKRGRDGQVKHMRIRVNKIASLADDLALALSASPVRIQAPIPGRSVIGIEVPNPQAKLVPLGEVFLSDEFQRLSSPLTLALGRTISGRPLVADLAKMPHLLMAGATGSGKSVCLNSIISCLLARNTPQSLRLVMIDPKRVELATYKDLPHLVGKVISGAEEAIAALRWAGREMDRRYSAFADIGARDLKGYNSRVARQSGKPLPRVVIVIDELADLMMTAPYDVERTLCRLAQMARATGIHLVVATQRPSTDILTGLIKANFPARIAFAVSSLVDSRVIIDSPGAERLLGRGDMLYMSPTSSRLVRAQGCHVSDEEIDALVTFWKQQAFSITQMTVQGQLWSEDIPQDDNDEDPLLADAIKVVKKEGRASVTMLQKHLRVGYNRAARMMDTLIEQGVVSAEADGPYASHSVLAEAAETTEEQEIETAPESEAE